MGKHKKNSEFDVIVIGSGTCGATIARQLSRQHKKVLILERGGNAPLKENLASFAAIIDQVKLGPKLATVRALTTGGSTGLYFGVVYYPALDTFRALGIDLARDLAQIREELPIAPLPDELIGAQSIRLRDSATARGHYWYKHDMLIDQSKCTDGYCYDARWRARSYVEEAVALGASLVNRATATRVLVESDQAIGVEYRLKKSMVSTETHRAYGAKIVLAAGELASPQLLRSSGLQEVGRHGFYCNPGHALYGIVPGLQGKHTFVGTMGGVEEDGIEYGDANLPPFLHRQMMLGSFRFKHMLSYPATIGISVKVRDALGGELSEDGRFHKQFNAQDHAKLEQGAQEARRILQDAGAKNIFNIGLVCGGRVGGLVEIQKDVDARLETRYRNLHVCDGSVIPEDMRGPPTLTLLCLGRYLARHLAACL